MSVPQPLGAPATYSFQSPTTTGTISVKKKAGTVYGVLVTVDANGTNPATVILMDGGSANAEPIVCPVGDTRGFMLSQGVSHLTDITLDVTVFPAGGTLNISVFYL